MSDEREKIKKRIKKLHLKSELCSLELEEAKEADEKYSREFAKDFELEMLFLRSNGEEKKKILDRNEKKHQKNRVNDQPKTKSSENQENEGLKKLHKKLAFELHPDRRKNEDHSEFLELQSAWDNQDYDALIGISSRAQLDLSELLDEQSILSLEKKLSEREKKLQSIRKSARWIWCESNKNGNLRFFIRRYLGINEKEFQSWMMRTPRNTDQSKEITGEHETIDAIGPHGTTRKALP
jgi:predicted transcriptional regulator YdeE